MQRSSKSAKDLVTVQEFFALVSDGQKADLLDGVIYLASPDSQLSNDLTGFIEFLMRGYDAAKNLGGKVFASRFAFKLTRYRAPEPDLAYVRSDRVHLVGAVGMKGGPDIAVEVVSRDSRSRDYGRKKKAYQKAGVAEYWIVDPLKDRVEFYRLREGHYELVSPGTDHRFRSEVLTGFWLDVNWLLGSPLPNSYQCLQEILR